MIVKAADIIYLDVRQKIAQPSTGMPVRIYILNNTLLDIFYPLELTPSLEFKNKKGARHS